MADGRGRSSKASRSGHSEIDKLYKSRRHTRFHRGFLIYEVYKVCVGKKFSGGSFICGRIMVGKGHYKTRLTESNDHDKNPNITEATLLTPEVRWIKLL